jgi:hypothetical protein
MLIVIFLGTVLKLAQISEFPVGYKWAEKLVELTIQETDLK